MALALLLAVCSLLSLSRTSECPAERARGLGGKPPPMFLPAGRPRRTELICDTVVGKDYHASQLGVKGNVEKRCGPAAR